MRLYYRLETLTNLKQSVTRFTVTLWKTEFSTSTPVLFRQIPCAAVYLSGGAPVLGCGIRYHVDTRIARPCDS